MNLTPEFRDRLLAAQPRDPLLQQRHQQEVQAMFERKLTATTKAVHVVFAVASAAMTVGLAAAAILAPRGLPPLARAGVAIGALFSLAWFLLMLRILRRGATNLRTDPAAMAALSWVFVVILVTLFMLLQSHTKDRLTGLTLVVNGLVFLVGAAAGLVTTVVNQSQLKTQEKLLELEYRLADLADRLPPKP